MQQEKGQLQGGLRYLGQLFKQLQVTPPLFLIVTHSLPHCCSVLLYVTRLPPCCGCMRLVVLIVVHCTDTDAITLMRLGQAKAKSGVHLIQFCYWSSAKKA